MGGIGETPRDTAAGMGVYVGDSAVALLKRGEFDVWGSVGGGQPVNGGAKRTCAFDWPV